MKTTKTILTEMGACSEAVKWAGRKTHKGAWETCKRGDWLLWIAGKLDIDRKKLVLAACACARAALKYVPEGEDRPRIAIETVEAWTRGEATIKQVRTAADAADAAAYAADAASYAAYAAADAAADAAYAAAYAAADAAYAASHKEMADIVRKIIPFSIIKQAIAEYKGRGETMNYDLDLTPFEGCKGCEGTAGRLGCTIHSPNVYIADPPKPFAQLFLRCPHCGKEMQLVAIANYEGKK